jgi:hypothetical protein
MKIETYLNAMCATNYSVDWPATLWEDDDLPEGSAIVKHRRQHAAFRARILRMFEERDAKIHELLRDWEIANYGDWREK